MRYLLIWMLLLVSMPAQAKWLEATSQNFIVYSDGGEDQLRAFTDKLEKFDQVMRIMTFTKIAPSPMKLKVYLVANRGVIAQIHPGKQPNLAGFYTTSMFGATAFVPRTRGNSVFDLDGEAVLFHEYAHHFMRQYFPISYPTWYSEGFAEYFSSMEFRKDGANVGTIAMQRVPSLYT